jgi:hypothetical protein
MLSCLRRNSPEDVVVMTLSRNGFSTHTLFVFKTILVGITVPPVFVCAVGECTFPHLCYSTRIAFCTAACFFLKTDWAIPLAICGFLLADFNSSVEFGSLEHQAYVREWRLISFPILGIALGVIIDIWQMNDIRKIESENVRKTTCSSRTST